MSHKSWVIGLAILTAVCLVTALAGPVGAQKPGQFDPTIEVIPLRSTDEISREIDNASAAKQLAQDNLRQAEQRLVLLDPNIKTRVAQMKETEAKRELAKRSKKQSEAMAYDAEVRANKNAIAMVGRLKDLRKSELEAARLRSVLADRTVQALQLEIELNKRRVERDSLATAKSGDVAVTTATQVIYDLEMKLLKAQKDQADANQDVSAKDKEVVDRRMRLYQAHAKLASPKS